MDFDLREQSPMRYERISQYIMSLVEQDVVAKYRTDAQGAQDPSSPEVEVQKKTKQNKRKEEQDPASTNSSSVTAAQVLRRWWPRTGIPSRIRVRSRGCGRWSGACVTSPSLGNVGGSSLLTLSASQAMPSLADGNILRMYLVGR